MTEQERLARRINHTIDRVDDGINGIFYLWLLGIWITGMIIEPFWTLVITVALFYAGRWCLVRWAEWKESRRPDLTGASGNYNPDGSISYWRDGELIFIDYDTPARG